MTSPQTSREHIESLLLEHETSYTQKPSGRYEWKCKCGNSAEDFGSWDECHTYTRKHWSAEIAALMKDWVQAWVLEATEAEHIRCLRVVEQQVDRYTGPTGGWLDCPKEVFAEIAVNMLHRVDAVEEKTP